MRKKTRSKPLPQMVARLTSGANPRIKSAAALQQKSERDKTKLFLVEGVRQIARALDSSFVVTSFFHAPSLYADQPAVMALIKRMSGRVPCFECGPAAFKKLSYREHPDGVIGVVAQKQASIEDMIDRADKKKQKPLVLVAQSLEKPGNLGALVRSADGAGVHGVIVTDERTDIFNPNVVQASSGTLFSVPIAIMTTQEAQHLLARHTIRIVATTPQAECLYTDVDLSGPLAIVVGAEHEGLSDAWVRPEHCLVRIPMAGAADSLNVSVAATVVLYEAVRQRQM
jgi:TrmH family RNA methyltransferase